jgi:hypothetical protein
MSSNLTLSAKISLVKMLESVAANPLAPTIQVGSAYPSPITRSGSPILGRYRVTPIQPTQGTILNRPT